jgi:hypothetical protein
MRRNVALAGFVMTPDEWEQLDELGRAQLLCAATRRDGWIPAWPEAPAEDEEREPYALYEVIWARG